MHDRQRGGCFIFASPVSRGTIEMVHQTLSLFVTISGSGKSFAVIGLYHSSWYSMTLMTERFHNLLIASSECWRVTTGEVYRVPPHGLVMSVFRFTARSRRKHTIYQLVSAAERGMDMQIICRSSHCRQYTSDVGYVILKKIGSAVPKI